MQYKFNGANTFVEAFAKMIATMNPVALDHFFEAMCHGIFEYLLAASSKNRELFSLISPYFGIVQTDS